MKYIVLTERYKRGDTIIIPFEITGSDKVTPYDCTDFDARFVSRGAAVIQKTSNPADGITWTTRTEGKGYVKLSPTDTAKAGKIYFEIEINDGTDNYTPLGGEFELEDDIAK